MNFSANSHCMEVINEAKPKQNQRRKLFNLEYYTKYYILNITCIFRTFPSFRYINIHNLIIIFIISR